MNILTKLLLSAILLLGGLSYGQLTSVSFTPSDDLTFNKTSNTFNSTATTVTTKVTTVSTNYDQIFIKFNLATFFSGLPAGAVIGSAKLRLTPTSEALGGNLRLQRVLSNWSESIISPNPPTLTATGIVTPQAALDAGKRVFDVTSLVRAFQAGSATNYGWMIRCEPETSTTAGNVYCSKEHGTTGNRPTLVIEWYVPFSISAVTVTNTSSAGTTTGSISVSVTDGSGNPGVVPGMKKNGTTTVTPGLSFVLGNTTTLNFPNLGYGWYGLKVNGAYDELYMAFLVGVNCEPVSILFNPGPEYVDDAVISSNNNSNDGASLINICSQNGSITNNSLIRFRLWMHPGLRPVEAKLTMKGNSHLYANGPNDAEFLLNTGDWSENTVTKNNDPAVSSSIAAVLPATTSLNQDQVIEISNFWNYWKTNNLLNYGMSLQYSLSSFYNRSQRFHSSDAASSSNRPTIQFLIDDATCDRTTYTLFKKKLDAGYATTYNGRLKFYFVEEYKIDAGKKIPLTLYDENSDIVAAIDFNGNALPGEPLLPAFAYTFDDNRYVLDLTSLFLTGGKYYTLQLTRSTGEKEYIKFLYTN